ncbi:MAG TPA: alcohol dehydrogenase catalytic domain-containing protein [Iamia sp.]|nr:alcohol dehydrogenase catalytic domain-containing protein [Iamia sp.]
MEDVPGVMTAAVLKGAGRLEVEEVPVPTLGAGDVLVAVDLCGVCGTDIHLVLEGWGTPGSWPGHEWIGRVAAVGPDVEQWRVGDPVVGGPVDRCGRCETCRAGRPSLCEHRDEPSDASPGQGAFATYKATPADSLLPLPEGLDPRAAALAEPLAVALHALTLSGITPGQRALVLGAGPIGSLTIAALRARGVDHVVCAEPGARRQDLARAAGATEVVHPDDLEVPSIAEPGRVVDGAVDVVFECSGRAEAMEAGLAQLVRAGTLVLVGAGIERPRFDPNRILLNELVVTGAYNHDEDGFERALELLASGALPVDALVEPGDVPLDGILEALRGLADGRLAGKVLVRP